MAFLYFESYLNYFGLNLKMSNIYPEQYFFYNLQVILRAFIIAVRYGFISEFRFKLLHTSRQDLSYIVKDLLLMNWISLHPDGLEPELDSVIWRT